jgi:hypothetical protein
VLRVRVNVSVRFRIRFIVNVRPRSLLSLWLCLGLGDNTGYS